MCIFNECAAVWASSLLYLQLLVRGQCHRNCTESPSQPSTAVKWICIWRCCNCRVPEESTGCISIWISVCILYCLELYCLLNTSHNVQIFRFLTAEKRIWKALWRSGKNIRLSTCTTSINPFSPAMLSFFFRILCMCWSRFQFKARRAPWTWAWSHWHSGSTFGGEVHSWTCSCCTSLHLEVVVWA